MEFVDSGCCYGMLSNGIIQTFAAAVVWILVVGGAALTGLGIWLEEVRAEWRRASQWRVDGIPLIPIFSQGVKEPVCVGRAVLMKW